MSKQINYDKFQIMWENDVVADLLFEDNNLTVKQNKNHVKSVFHKPDSEITREDVLDFIKRQIFDKHNANAKQILNNLELTTYYTWDIFCITHGISDRNSFWVKFDGEELEYEEDIKTRKILNKK